MFRTLLIFVVVLGLSVGGAFVAGTAYAQRTAAQAQPAAIPFSPAQGGPDQLTLPGTGIQAGAGAIGTIARVDGRTLYVTSADGKETKVTLPEGARIEKQAEGALSDLKPGTQVAVAAQGPRAADGSMTAASVALLPENAVRFEGVAPAQSTPRR